MGGVKAIPEGYTSVTPYLFISGATEALEFYKSVFGAEERLRIPGRNNTIGHAEIAINGAVIMLADECPQLQCRSPKTIGGSPVMGAPLCRGRRCGCEESDRGGRDGDRPGRG
jgi:PhnB protein